MSIRLYVGNLPKEDVERQDLETVFGEASESLTIKVIKDRKTGKCRGFAFVTVPSEELAETLIEEHNGREFMDSQLKVERAQPRAAGDDEGESAAPAPKKRSGKKAKAAKGSSVNETSGPVQPDPRWADELAKLKEMLAAQTTNS